MRGHSTFIQNSNIGDSYTGLYDVKRGSYYYRGGGSTIFKQFNMVMLNGTPFISQCVLTRTSGQCEVGITGENENCFQWKNNLTMIYTLQDHEFPIDSNIYAEDSVNYYILLTIMRHTTNALFQTTLTLCSQNENQTCGWNTRNNIINAYTKRLVVSKDGTTITDMGLGTYSFLNFNLATYSQKIQAGFSSAANFVIEGGTHKIKFSAQFQSTGDAYNDVTNMEISDFRVNLGLINTVALNPVFQYIIFNEGNKIHFYEWNGT